MKVNKDRHCFRCLLVLVMIALITSFLCEGLANAKEVKFAVMVGFTGVTGYAGDQVFRGAMMAKEYVEKRGGLDGIGIKLIKYDTRSEKSESSILTRKIGAQSDIIGIIGPNMSRNLIAMAPVAAKVGIVTMSPCSVVKWGGEFNEYTFRTDSSEELRTPFLLGQVKKNFQNFKTMGIMYDIDNDWAAGLVKQIKEIAPKNDLRVTITEAHRTGDFDYSAQITKFMREKPDIIYIASTVKEGALFIKQARDRGLTSLFVGSSGIGPSEVYERSGGRAEGVIVAFPFDEAEDHPLVRQFVKRYKELYPEDYEKKGVSYYVTLGYDTLLLFADVVKRAKTTNDRKKFRDVLGQTTHLRGLNGYYTFKGKGDNVEPRTILFVMRKGKYVRYSK